MAKKRISLTVNELSINEVFPRFVASQKAKGVCEKTIETYYSHLNCISKHIDLSITFAQLTKEDFENMIGSMRDSNLAHNSISSYLRVFRTFINWCKREGYTALEVPKYLDMDTVKETYTDDELKELLKKPSINSGFTEYRNWVIINFLLNSGCRASTIRNIQNRDVDIPARQVYFRHTKNRKVQVIPLCNLMVNIIHDYMAVRKGDPSDYLFCNEYGELLTETALRTAISRYNKARGVQKTSIHLFRHTFARKYLIDCGGNAFTLQKILGHSTLKMTKHYCEIFDADLANSFDRFSPLAQINSPKVRITRNNR